MIALIATLVIIRLRRTQKALSNICGVLYESNRTNEKNLIAMRDIAVQVSQEMKLAKEDAERLRNEKLKSWGVPDAF